MVEYLPNTAITTWSGFIYQGKVAIYHVLKLLQEPNTCRNYVLQLDSLEDFAILDATNHDDWELKSLHQVKAKKAQRFSQYRAAFDQLRNKSICRDCRTVFFHLAREITDQPIQDIERGFPPIKLYMCGNDTYCAVNEIDDKIEGLIKSLPCRTGKVTTDAYASRVRECLDQIITKQVLKIHRIIHDNIQNERNAAYTQIIEFSEFQAIVDHEDIFQRGLGGDYYFYKLVGDLCRYYQEYCIEAEDGANWGSEIAQKLSRYISEITSLENEGFVLFIKQIMPHRDFEFETLEQYKDSTFSQNEIRDAFLEILHELTEVDLGQKKFFQWHANGEFYLPTTINEHQRYAPRTCRQILDNAGDTDLSVMYEGKNLITSYMNVESISSEVHNITSVNEYGTGNRDADRITRFKKVSLISLNRAKEEINA